MVHHLRNRQPVVHVTVQHLADQVDAVFGKRKERNAKWVVKDFVDVVEWILLVHNCVQEDTQRPHILLFAAVGLALEDLGGGVI